MTPLTPEEKALAALLEKAMVGLVSSADLAALTAALKAGDMAKVFAQIDLSPLAVAMGKAEGLIAKEILTEQKASAAKMGITTSLTKIDPEIVRAAQELVGHMVTAVTDAVRESIREIVTTAFASQALTVDDVAGLVSKIVGPTPRVANAIAKAWLLNYTGAIAKGVDPAKAKTKADKIRDIATRRAIKSRARTIARTEMMNASNWGRYITWHQADNQGLILPGMNKQWITAPEGSRYGPPCPICLPLNGLQVPWDANFPTGDPMPPAHPNCRCTAVLRAPTIASVA